MAVGDVHGEGEGVVSHTRKTIPGTVGRPRWYQVDRGSLKQRTRENRRRIDAQILRRALGGDVDVPTGTRNVECEDRWCHD
jgi:hypothetical protein